MATVKQYRVCIEQRIRIPFRNSEPVERCFYVNAKTKPGAIKAIKDAGCKGNITSVDVGTKGR